MNTAEAILISLQSLWANKLRSVLTLLGVVIGVAAVIAVVTFVEGINAYMAERLFRFGADVFVIRKIPQVNTDIDQFLEAEKRKDITLDEYQALADRCRSCQVVAASSNHAGAKVAYGEQSSSDSVARGWTPSFVPIYDLEVVAGRPINETDQENVSSVVVVGGDIVENLMPGTDPLGKEIRVDGRPYTVIGVGKREGKAFGASRDNYVIMPLSSWLRQYGSRQSITLSGKAHGVPNLSATIDEARAIVRARRHDMPGKPDSFSLETNQTSMGIFQSLTASFFIAMIAIAAVALVVGGIVIMNIMLVSVTERTREIGIRKALGARRQDVLRQFLIESSIMALLGGILGVVLGAGGAKLITALIGMPSVIRLWAVMAGLIVATSVGLFFGVYPARRASMLEPIAALRFEL